MTAGPTNEEVQAIIGKFAGLYSCFPTKTNADDPLLLAHYTSVQVAEKILKNNEIWFAESTLYE